MGRPESMPVYRVGGPDREGDDIMPNTRFSGFVMTALAAVLFAYVIGLGESEPRLSTLLDTDQFTACGLDKLTVEESDLLFALLWVPRGDFLSTTAFRRMETDGWVPVDLIAYGTRNDDAPWPGKTPHPGPRRRNPPFQAAHG